MLFGLKGTHGRAQINRAALEAVGYSTYQHLLLFEELGKRPGGSSQRAAARKTLHGCRSCDMAGMPLTIPEPFQCSSYGDAMLAALGVGALESLPPLRAALPQGRILQPDRKNHEFYQEHYPIFRDLYLEKSGQDAQNAKNKEETILWSLILISIRHCLHRSVRIRSAFAVAVMP